MNASPVARDAPDADQRATLFVVASALLAVAIVLGTVALATRVTELLPGAALFIAWSAVTAWLAVIRPAGRAARASAMLVGAARGGLWAIAGPAALFALAIGPAVPLRTPPHPGVAAAPLLALAACWLFARHFRRVSPDELPEAPAFVRWARLTAWVILSVTGVGALRFLDATAPWSRPAQFVIGLLVLAVVANAALAPVDSWVKRMSEGAGGGGNGGGLPAPFPAADLRILDVIAHRNNPISSALDALERFLGVDLRGSWAIRVVRRGAEPLAIGALFLTWIGTSLTQVQVDETAVVERLGVVEPGDALGPGLHVLLPWPFDHVVRFPTARVQTVAVGHESSAALVESSYPSGPDSGSGSAGGNDNAANGAGPEPSDDEDSDGATGATLLSDSPRPRPAPASTASPPPSGTSMRRRPASANQEEGPENVLWARQHEAVEYTLLLGNGRELVTIDGTLSYRARDLRAWLYGSADGAAVVRALVYASVTRHTADRSLEDVLSENLASFTHDVAVDVQKDADRLGLGIEVAAMTVGGMHPPVAVAEQYEAVVSAQVDRDTKIMNAKTSGERSLPAATASAFTAVSDARAKALTTLATAKGDAETFRGVRESFRAEPTLFEYRKRLEALEGGLAGRRLVIVDDRIERDGASLWLTE